MLSFKQKWDIPHPAMVLVLVNYLLFHFVVVSSSVLLSLPASCSLLTCVPSVLFPSCVPGAPLQCDPPPETHTSHISLVSTDLFPASLHLHLIPSLVWCVFKPVLFPHSLSVCLFTSTRLLWFLYFPFPAFFIVCTGI